MPMRPLHVATVFPGRRSWCAQVMARCLKDIAALLKSARSSAQIQKVQNDPGAFSIGRVSAVMRLTIILRQSGQQYKRQFRLQGAGRQLRTDIAN